MKTFDIVLIGDIGGTNSIFKLIIKDIQFDKNYKFNLELETKKIKNIKNLFEVIKKEVGGFLKKKILYKKESLHFKFKKIIFACAGPLNKEKEEIILTNINLKFSKKKLSEITKTPLKNIILLNDIEAIYYYIKNKLRKDDYISIKIKEEIRQIKKEGLIISVGTGLGVLYYNNTIKIPTESSHLLIPKILIEIRFKGLYDFISKKLNKKELEWEDLISGKNLIFLYQYIFKLNSIKNRNESKITQKEISYNYKNKEKKAEETYNLFYQLILIFLNEINKIFQTNNLIFTGGVIEKNLPNKAILNNLKKEKIKNIIILKDHKNSINGLEKLI